MFKYQGFEYTLDEVTQAAQKENISVDEYVNKHSLETVEVTDEIQTTPTKGKTNGAAEVDAAVAPVATPSRASMIVDAQPESTESGSVDTSLVSQDDLTGRERIRASREAKIEQKKQDYADQLADPSQQPLIDSFSSAVSSVLYENGIYKLDVEGENVEDLITAGVKDKVRDQALSNYYRLNPGQDLPMEDNLEQVLEDLIEKTRIKEVKEKRVAEDTALVKARQEGTYQSTIDAGFKHMVEDLTPTQRQFAKINQDVKKYQKISNDPNESETNRQAATNEIARLMPSYEASFEMMQTNDLGPELKENEQGYYRQQQKKKKAKYQYLFDPITNEKLTITEATSSGKGQDKSKEIKELTAQYANLDQELLERNLFQYLLNDKNNTAALNTTYDLKPTGQSAAEMATILGSKGYQADADGVIKNIPLKELRFMNDDFLQSSLKAAQPEGRATVIPDLPATIDYLYDQKLELGLQKEALNNTYFLNIDPASQKQTAVDVAGRFIETALEGAGVKPGVLPTSARKKLDEAEKLFLDAGITITPEQKENFERSFGMKLVEQLGSFTPELAKFFVANKIAGAAGITRVISNLFKAGRKAEAVALSLALEEVKFQGVTLGEAPTLAGAGFAAGGMTASRFIGKFGGELARFNNLIEKTVGGGVGFTAGSNSAIVAEALYSDLKGSKSFKKYLKDYYGEMEEPLEDLALEFFTGGILGGLKLNRKTDFTSISQRRKLLSGLKRDISSGKYEGAEVEKKQKLAADFERSINQADAKFNDLNIGSQKARADEAYEVLAANAPNTPKAIEAERTIANYEANKTAATRSIKRQEANINKSEIFKDKTGFNKVEIVEGRETFLDPNTKAEYDPISRSIKIDLESYRPGVLAEEVFHATFKAAFDQNPTAARVFKTSIQNDVNNALKGKKFTVNGKEDLTFEEAINESYGKASRPEEYVANVTNFLRQPKYRDLLLEPGLLASVKRTIVNIGNKAGLNFNSKTDFTTANQLINFLEGFGSVVESGSARGIRKKFEQFQDIVIDGKKLVDIETGKEVVSEVREAKEISETNKELASRNLKVEERIIQEGAFKVSELEGEAREKVVRELEEINRPLVKKLAFQAANNPKILALEKGKRKTAQEFEQGYNEELTKIINNYEPIIVTGKPEDLGKRINFGAYLAPRLKLRYGNVLEQLKKGEVETTRIEGSAAEKMVVEPKGGETTTAVLEKGLPKKPSEGTEYIPAQLNKVVDKIKKSGKVKELEGLTPEQVFLKAESEAINKAFKGKEISSIKQAEPPKEVIELYAEMLGMNNKVGLEILTQPKRNWSIENRAGARAAQQFILKNINYFWSTLPKTKTQPAKGSPKATGIYQTKIGKAFYNKQGKLIGTFNQFKNVFEGKNTIVNGQEFNKIDSKTGEQMPLFRDAQHFKAGINFIMRNRIMEEMVPDTAKRLSSGTRFAKEIELQTNELDIDFKSNQKDLFVKKVKTILEKNPEVTLEQAIEFEAARIGKSKGFAYENVIIDKLDKVKIPGFKVSKEAGGNKVGVPDFASSIHDAKFDVEVKLEKAQYSSVTLRHRNQKTSFSKDKGYTFTERLQEDLINKSKKALSDYRKRAGELGADLKLYDKTGKLPMEIYKTLQTEGLQKNITKSTNFNQDIISELYSKKIPPTNYIQIKNKGLFFMGKNPLNLPIPEFKADVNVTLRVSRGSRTTMDGVEMTTMNLRILPDKLTGLSKSKYSLDNVSEIKSLMETDAVKILEKNKEANIKVNNPILPSSQRFAKDIQGGDVVIKSLENLDKALKNARDPKAPIKKIRIFDFDDTLAKTNSKVIVNTIDGKTRKITATEFAREAEQLQAEGATFDFAEFSKVVDGKKGPVFKAIENIVKARGAEDVFILTARPSNSAVAIKEFMDALGVDIPIENITGLGDGTPQAKGRWVTGKAAEGYNDFFFVDDAYKNVKAVKQALDVFDVKSKVQQAKVRYAKDIDLSKDFNDIIENKTGIGADKVYGRAKAQVVGASKGSIFKGIPYSAQDFTGLLYPTLGKGKVGDQQMAWYKYNLLDPFARGVNDISRDRVAMMNDYKSLKKELGVIPKDLRKKLPGEPYTKEQAVRVYTWNQLQGMEVPGVSKADLKTLNEFVNNSPELKVFAEQLVAINKGDGYAKPKETWLTGSITTDLLEGLNTTKRAKYLEQWQTNADQIFSEANLNKLEAAYGKKYRKAIENSLQRMKTGRNRSFSDDGLTGRFTDWLNGSIGVTMFFNTRSALLQTLSSVNFVNFSDNNPLKAAKAFGNQKQYWKDFKYLMNSDFLKERRGGLRMNVNEADIAEAASKNGPRGVVNKLLQFGFTPTQIADSFAIASGGATFYRNRVKTYEKQGLSTAEAEAKAFEDFRETAEESQQSSRPDRISMQQAGPLGRPILAYGNTPAQYVRLTDKAIKDLKAGRGDAKTNISKIIYYTTVQNLIFNSLQQGLFAIAFGEADADDEKYEKKYVDVANGMADSILRGTGVGGAAISVGKNAIIRIMREQEKKQPKLEKVGYELTKISPPVSSKLSKINQAARSYQWDKDEMISKGFSIDNPAYLAGANVIAATTNVPLDRAIKKVNNVIAATEADAELWERLALMGGWQDWEIGIDEEKPSNKPQPRKTKPKSRNKKRKTIVR